jgi:hypothetical protein
MITKQLVVVALSLMVLGWSSSRPVAQTVHPKGATIWDPFRARNGLTFITAPDGTARLVGMLGDVVNTWRAPANDSLLVKMPILGSAGHILAFRGPIPVPGYGRFRGSIVTEYDYGGNKVWEYTAGPKIDIFPFGGFHHDLARLDNGNTLLMASVLVDGSPISNRTLIDDCIIEVNPEGTIVWAWYTWQHFDEFEFTDAAKAFFYGNGGDWAHANSVTVIPDNTLGDPRFTPGNLVISYRNLNTIIVVEKSTGKIVWKMGPNNAQTIGQHYAYMIPFGLEGAGNLLAFDNGASGGFPPRSREYSRVVEINPIFNLLPWTYTASKSALQNWSFFSPFIANAQRLGGGNTLITEGTKGRIFEVTRTGAIVWEYMSPFPETRLDGGVEVVDQNVYRAFRLPIYWPFFPAPPDGGV